MMPERIRTKRDAMYINSMSEISFDDMITLDILWFSENIHDTESGIRQEAWIVQRGPDGGYVRDENNAPCYKTDEKGDRMPAKGGLIVLPEILKEMTENSRGNAESKEKAKADTLKPVVEKIRKITEEDYSEKRAHPLAMYSPVRKCIIKIGMRGIRMNGGAGDVFGSKSFIIVLPSVDSLVLRAFADSIRIELKLQSVFVVDKNCKNMQIFVEDPLIKRPVVPMRTSLSSRVMMSVIDFLEKTFFRGVDPIAIREKQVEENRRKRENLLKNKP